MSRQQSRRRRRPSHNGSSRRSYSPDRGDVESSRRSRASSLSSSEERYRRRRKRSRNRDSSSSDSYTDDDRQYSRRRRRNNDRRNNEWRRRRRSPDTTDASNVAEGPTKSKMILISELPCDITEDVLDKLLRVFAISNRFSPPNAIKIQHPDNPVPVKEPATCVAYVDFPSVMVAQSLISACGSKGFVIDGHKYPVQFALSLKSEISHRQLAWACIMCSATNAARLPTCSRCQAGRIADCLVIGSDGRTQTVSEAAGGVKGSTEILPVPDHSKMKTVEGSDSYLFDEGSKLYYDTATKYYFNNVGKYFRFDGEMRGLVRVFELTAEQMQDSNYRPDIAKIGNFNSASGPSATREIRVMDDITPSVELTVQPAEQKASSIASILEAAQLTAQASRSAPKVQIETQNIPTPKSNSVSINPVTVDEEETILTAFEPLHAQAGASAMGLDRTIKPRDVASNTQRSWSLAHSKRRGKISGLPLMESVTEEAFNAMQDDEVTGEDVLCFACLRIFNTKQELRTHCSFSSFHQQNIKDQQS